LSCAFAGGHISTSTRPRKIDDNLLGFLGLVTGLRVAHCVTHRDPLQNRRHRGVIRTPLFATVVAWSDPATFTNTAYIGWHEGTAMCEKEQRRSSGERSSGDSERGGEDEGRGCTHRGIISTTFGYAGGNTIPRSYCPFGKNGSGTRCLPLNSRTLCGTQVSKNQQGSSAKTRTLDLARTRSGSCN
jgi:hypothetical protein